MHCNIGRIIEMQMNVFLQLSQASDCCNLLYWDRKGKVEVNQVCCMQMCNAGKKHADRRRAESGCKEGLVSRMVRRDTIAAIQ